MCSFPLSNMSGKIAASYPPVEEDDDEIVPWDREDFIPRVVSSGKQKSPNQIRCELQRYMDALNETQTAIIGYLGVNSNSYRKFMNPKTYKDQLSAAQNGTCILSCGSLFRSRKACRQEGEKNARPMTMAQWWCYEKECHRVQNGSGAAHGTHQ